ncbi:hypothetical protein C4573_01615 [Candidatus Woesearchaeota archaeon]|nr:MAG: hypothetical protein C4573_01615 [Candidatus Woesearchaeota archaeon]
MKKSKHEYEKHDEVALDFSKLKSFFSNKLALIFLAMLIVIFVLYIRLQPLSLNITDDWAKSSVHNFYRNTLADAINQQYPNLPSANKDALIDKNLEAFLKENQQQVQTDIQQTAASYKSRLQYVRNGETQTFLGDLDSYYYLRQAKNFVTTGDTCDERRDGVCYDSYIVAPIGASAVMLLHPYAIGIMYHIVSFLSVDADQDVLLMRSSFLVPVVLAVLSALLAFLIAKKASNTLGGILAAVLVTVSPIVISRTSGSDTDTWNIFFPLLVVWLFFEALSTPHLKKKIVLLVLSGLSVGFFSFAWGGWWYIFDFLIVATLAYLVYKLFIFITERKQIKHALKDKRITDSLLMLVVFFVAAGIFVTLFTGFSNFTTFFVGPLGFKSLDIATHADLWPNIFTTVAELNPANIPSVVGQSGGTLFFFLALMGGTYWFMKRFSFSLKDSLVLVFIVLVNIILLSSFGLQLQSMTFFVILTIPIIITVLLYGKTLEDSELKFSLLLLIWFLGTMYASLSGVRFILLLAPIVGISAGIFLATLYVKVKDALSSFMNLKGWLVSVLLLVVIALLLLQPVKAGYQTSKSFVPSISSGWVNSLQIIEENSQSNAIINSWWDFGHWFKYWADRRVTLDGVTQNSPQAQWLGRMIQTSSEHEAIGIMRMLDCGSNTAFDEVNKKYQDTELSIRLLNKLIVATAEEAEIILADEGFNAAATQKVLSYTHCNPPENYFITSSDMIGKASVWAHFGLWSFERAYLVNNIKEKTLQEATVIMKERYGYDEETAKRTYFEVQGLTSDPETNAWISPWPGYITSTKNCIDANTSVICTYNAGLGSNGQQQVVLEALNFSLSQGKSANESVQLLLGAYQNGIKVGGSVMIPSTIYFNTEGYGELQELNLPSGTFAYAVVLAKVDDGYVSVIADKALATSLFTKLYYLDGAYTEHFEKFHEESTVFGDRIVVWKVNWDVNWNETAE